MVPKSLGFLGGGVPLSALRRYKEILIELRLGNHVYLNRGGGALSQYYGTVALSLFIDTVEGKNNVGSAFWSYLDRNTSVDAFLWICCSHGVYNPGVNLFLRETQNSRYFFTLEN